MADQSSRQAEQERFKRLAQTQVNLGKVQIAEAEQALQKQAAATRSDEPIIQNEDAVEQQNRRPQATANYGARVGGEQKNKSNNQSGSGLDQRNQLSQNEQKGASARLKKQQQDSRKEQAKKVAKEFAKKQAKKAVTKKVKNSVLRSVVLFLLANPEIILVVFIAFIVIMVFAYFAIEYPRTTKAIASVSSLSPSISLKAFETFVSTFGK